jgi:hypothetical protein
LSRAVDLATSAVWIDRKTITRWALQHARMAQNRRDARRGPWLHLGRAEFFALPALGWRTSSGVLETVYVCQIRTWVIQRAVRNGSPSSASTRTTTKHARYCTSPEAKLIASASMMVLNKNDSRAWTSDKRRIPLEVMETSDT